MDNLNGRKFFLGFGLIAVFISCCPLLFAGKLVAWGSNSSGQCNVPEGDDYIAVAAAWHSLALKSDGSIVSWGQSGAGVYSPPSGNNFVAISAGNYHCLALRSDGSIAAWGSICLDVPPGNDYIAIAAGGTQSVALRANGTLVSWGAIKTVPPGNDFVAIGSGSYHNIALRSNGNIVRWGSFGIQEFSGNFVRIAAGENYDIALRSDGSVFRFPENSMVATPSFISIDAGDYYWAGIRADGTLVDFGGNLTPIGNDYVDIAVGVYHGLAIQNTPDSDPPTVPGNNGFYSGGNGTSTNPYQILSVDDWQRLMQTPGDWYKHFILVKDIDLSGLSLTPIGNESTKFTGVFDGNNHIIFSPGIHLPNKDGVGIFGYIGNSGKITRLGVEQANIVGQSYVGGLVGWNEGKIEFCYVKGNITGRYSIGGLVGWNCGSGIINACFSDSNVLCSGQYQVGGLVGVHSGLISNSYSLGTVSGPDYVGGLISESYCFGGCGTIINSFSATRIQATFPDFIRVAGLIGNGFLGDSRCSGCLWDTTASGCLVGVGGGGAINGVIGKTTTEMQRLSTFLDAGWDFTNETNNGVDDFWTMPSYGGYPLLAWASKEIILLNPNGGEIIASGEEITIQWASRGYIQNVGIKYSIDGGQKWFDLSQGTIANSGSFNWIVPVANTNRCLIKISNAENQNIYDISDTTFTIIHNKTTSFPTLSHVLESQFPAVRESGRDFVKTDELNKEIIFTILKEEAGYAYSNIFGIYSATNPDEKIEIFTGMDSISDSVVLHFDAKSGLMQNLRTQQTANIGDFFGFYIITPENGGTIFYTDSSLNFGQSEHGLIFDITGFVGLIEENPNVVVAFEDLLGLGDGDYNDMVIGIKGIAVIGSSGAYCIRNIPGDLNSDCKVNLIDFAILMTHWLECNLDPQEACFD